MTILLVAAITFAIALLAMFPKQFNVLMVVIMSVAAIAMLAPMLVYTLAHLFHRILWDGTPVIEWFRGHGVYTFGPLGIVFAFVAVLFLQGINSQENQDGP